MSEYSESVKPTVDDAVKWAGESAKFWMDSYVRLVDAAATGTVDADCAAREMSAAVAAGARDMARAWATGLALGATLAKIDLPAPGPAPPGEGEGRGPGG